MKAKNIGLLATLALVTTVGGVYAAFTYNNGTMLTANSSFDNITIDEATQTSPKGTLSAALASPVIAISNGGSNVAKLTVSGSVNITFTSEDEGKVEDHIYTKGIPVQITFTVESDTLNGKHMFALYTETDGEATKQLSYATKSSDGVFNWTVNLADVIKFNDGVDGIDTDLGTFDEYTAFANVAQSAKITISVDEYVA